MADHAQRNQCWQVQPRPHARVKTIVTSCRLCRRSNIGQSGNIITTKPGTEKELTAQVHELILAEFGVDVPVIIRSEAEVRAVLKVNPLAQPATDGSKYLAIFLSESPAKERVTALEIEDFSPEVFKIVDRTAFVWAANGVKALKLSHTFMEKHFGFVATARNWNTLHKIASKL